MFQGNIFCSGNEILSLYGTNGLMETYQGQLKFISIRLLSYSFLSCCWKGKYNLENSLFFFNILQGSGGLSLLQAYIIFPDCNKS